MDVDDAPGPAAREVLAQYAQETREHDEADALFIEKGVQALLEAGLFHIFASDTGLFRALERVCVRAAAHYEREFNVRHFSARGRVYQSLEVRASAGDEYGRPQHSATAPSVALTISPQT